VAGDQLLVAAGQRLRGCLRDGDTAARLGGDEFAVCAEFGGSGPGSGAQALAERIVEAFNEPFALGGIQVAASVSIGVAVAGAATTGAVDMLREADLALYAGKNAGKRTYRFFEPGLQEAASARLAGRAALEAAINNDELRLHFQPIVRLSDGCIVGAEALVRWEHPDRGLVPPAEFIPLAEESGLVVPLGAWVLDRACAQLKRWSTGYPGTGQFKMTVNVSPRQLHAGDLLETVERALAKHGLGPQGLTLEITESVLVQDDKNIRACLSSLDQRGVSFALDDFGTGYSALSYLQRFPLKTLKIDRSFVAVMDGTGGRALIDAIIAMANSLGLEVVAEGIEFEGQARQLAALGCQFGQGYFYARPMAADALEALLAKGGPLSPAGSYPSLGAGPVPVDAVAPSLP
jgi:predicted signal transduction protein with EAL and GGDEF domain